MGGSGFGIILPSRLQTTKSSRKNCFLVLGIKKFKRIPIGGAGGGLSVKSAKDLNFFWFVWSVLELHQQTGTRLKFRWRQDWLTLPRFEIAFLFPKLRKENIAVRDKREARGDLLMVNNLWHCFWYIKVCRALSIICCLSIHFIDWAFQLCDSIFQMKNLIFERRTEKVHQVYCFGWWIRVAFLFFCVSRNGNFPLKVCWSSQQIKLIE